MGGPEGSGLARLAQVYPRCMSNRRRRSRSGGEVAQKGKDQKRPRHFHRGRAQGVKDDRLMREVLEPAFAAAEGDREAVGRVSAAHRREQAEWEDCLGQLERVAPFAPAAFPSVLG